MLSRPIVFGNWKMHGLRDEADALAGRLADRKAAYDGPGTLGVFPPTTAVWRVAQRLQGTGILVGGQDAHQHDQGPFTGSVSAPMLKDAGAAAVIVGHSERRHGLGETDEVARDKAEAGLRSGLVVVLCIGETEAEWKAGRTLEVLDEQIAGSMPREVPRGLLVLAYEPVWAIGTGRSAGCEDIERVHALVRERLATQVPGGDGGDVPILYGGSVKAGNAKEILAVPNVDGALVGGASLDADGFFAILEAGAA